MKAYIDEKGVLTVSPDTALEAYALKHWVTCYAPIVKHEPVAEKQDSILQVDTTWPREQPK